MTMISRLRHVTGSLVLIGGIQLAAAGATASDQSWTGLYLGAGFGYGTFVDSFTTFAIGPPPAQDRPFTDFGGEGWLGTVVVGYDQQVQNVVLGVFADYDWTG